MITVVIPALNEEHAVGSTVKSVFSVFAGQSQLGPVEVIVVDDGSTDSTVFEAQGAGAKVVKHPQNMGYGRSLKDGIMASTYETIVIADADGTYPVDAIPRLLEEYKKGFDMVVGTRSGKHYDESFRKKLLRCVLKSLVEFTAGTRIPDINSGFRVFSRNTVVRYLSRLCDTFSFTTSLTLAYLMTGRSVAYAPISYNARVGTTKVRIFRDSMRTMQSIVEAILFYNPLKIYLLFSTFLILLSAVGFTFSVLLSLLAGYVIGLSCLLMAILMFGLGLLAVLLKHILHQGDETR